jgi:hypothetical protein
MPILAEAAPQGAVTMAIKGLTLSSVKNYVSTTDPEKGSENETVFILKPLDSFATTFLFDSGVNLMSEGNGRIEVYRMNLEAVRIGLAGWKNFQDGEGNQLEFKTETLQICGKPYQALSQDLLKLMPFSLVRELAEEIRALGSVTEEEAKN